MTNATPMEIGKAWTAHQAYNKHARKDQIKDFDLRRWLNVVHALNGKTKPALGLKGTGTYERKATPSKRWTKAQREKYLNTIYERTRKKNFPNG